MCGPGHAREALLTDLKKLEGTRMMKSVATSMAGRAGANEVLREGLAGNLLSEHAISREIELIEKAWELLSTNGAVAYGEVTLKKAMNEGAIETLLISADILRDETKMIGSETWLKWVDGLSGIGAELVQCSTDHDSGQKLLGIGGEIALLRFKI